MTSEATSEAKRRSRSPPGGKLPRQFISTWHNYTELDVQRFKDWCAKRTTFSRVGRETGAEGKTPHLQGFHQNSGGLSFKAFCKSFREVDVTPVGVDNGASEYVLKEGDLAFEVGEYRQKKPGTRTDLAAVAELAKAGASMQEIAEQCPTAVVQYPAGISRLAAIYERPRDRNIPKRIFCLWGPTGVCKTRRCFDICESRGSDFYVWDADMKSWWDGYAAHKYVIMDEFRAQIPMGTLLRLLDRYPTRVQFKGGSCQFVADYIFITSPKHPREWYFDSMSDKIDQLIRRFEKIVHVTSADMEIELL